MAHRTTFVFAPLLLLVACSPDSMPTMPADAPPAEARTGPPGRGGALGVVYVSGQDLYFDTFASAETLPNRGRFQKLDMVDGQPVTEFGPGQPGYLGGRWWVDTDGDGLREDTDTFFLCPLLGPGRETP